MARTVSGVPVRGSGTASDRWTSPVKDKDLTAPPGAPSLGDRYIVASVASGAWTGHETEIAEWAGSIWQFFVPTLGLTTYVEDETEYYSWNGTAWVQESAGPHASTHEDGGTDEVHVENLPTTGLLGEVPTSDGAGGLTMVDPGEKPLSGFPNRTDSTIGMNGANFEIAPAVSTFDFWSDGTKFTKSGTDAVAISNDKTLHFVYYDTSGVLQVSTSAWDLLAGTSPVATVFKDGANYVITEERHGWRRSRDWHNWAHRTIGARYDSGLTGTFLDATFSVVQGVVADEDIFYDTGGAKTTCQLWYRDTGLAAMRVELGVATPYKAAVGVIQYDNAGVLTNVSNNRFVNSYVYATNVPAYPIVVVVGQAEYVTLAGAQEEAFPSILLSTAEWKLLYRSTYKNVGGTPTHQADTDFRLVSTGPAQSPSSNSHTGLIDRDAENAHPALAVAPDVSGFGAILSAADDTVQKALDTLDSHGAEHKDGGADEVSTVTPAASVIPKTDGSGKLPLGFMPDAVVGGVNYQGTWDAATNTPTLASGVGTKGHYYVVSTPGSTNLDGITDWKANDWAIYNGTAWEKIDNTDQVSSVFGRTGAVAAVSGDYTHAEIASQGVDDHHAQIHASSHENGGGDEINVGGLSGELADLQPPKAHQASHNEGGSDQLDVEDLATDSLTPSDVVQGHTTFGKLSIGQPNGWKASVLSTLNTPPGAAVGVRHRIGASPTGTWTGHAHKIAEKNTMGNWTILENTVGDVHYQVSDGRHYEWSGSAWTTLPHAHAAEHKDGGIDELDVEELASAGVAGALFIPDGAGAVSAKPFDRAKWFAAASLDSPDGTADAPNSMDAAPISASGANSNVPVRLFPDDDEQGVLIGPVVRIPAGVVSIGFDINVRAAADPGAAKDVRLGVHAREFTAGAAVGSWTNHAVTYTDLVDDDNFTEGYFSVTLANLGLAAGDLCQLGFSRDGPDGADELTGDLELLMLGLTWI